MSNSLEAARKTIPPGLIRIPRDPKAVCSSRSAAASSFVKMTMLFDTDQVVAVLRNLLDKKQRVSKKKFREEPAPIDLTLKHWVNEAWFVLQVIESCDDPCGEDQREYRFGFHFCRPAKRTIRTGSCSGQSTFLIAFFRLRRIRKSSIVFVISKSAGDD